MEKSGDLEHKSESAQLDEFAIRTMVTRLEQEQNFALGIVGGVSAGVVGAIIWAAIGYFTGYHIGLLAIGVGFLVGFAIRWLGKGLEVKFGIAGAIIALFSVLLGNFLANIGFLAAEFELGYVETLLNFNYAMTFELMAVTFSPIDLLFYAIAAYQGYRFSFRKVQLAEAYQPDVPAMEDQPPANKF